MTEVQQRFLSNSNYYQGSYNDYDSGYDYGGREYNTQQGHDSGYGGYGGKGHHATYRGHVPHNRPILIIQPPSQPQTDPIIEGLTSLIPLAYLLPLALLATVGAPTTTVVGNGRRKRQVSGKNSLFCEIYSMLQLYSKKL